MRVRQKTTGALGSAYRFNTHGLGEIIVGFDEGDQDSMRTRDFDVQLPDGSWKDMRQAFEDRDILPDNLNATFGTPDNDTCKQRGYNP